MWAGVSSSARSTGQGTEGSAAKHVGTCSPTVDHLSTLGQHSSQGVPVPHSRSNCRTYGRRGGMCGAWRQGGQVRGARLRGGRNEPALAHSNKTKPHPQRRPTHSPSSSPYSSPSSCTRLDTTTVDPATADARLQIVNNTQRGLRDKGGGDCLGAGKNDSIWLSENQGKRRAPHAPEAKANATSALYYVLHETKGEMGMMVERAFAWARQPWVKEKLARSPAVFEVQGKSVGGTHLPTAPTRL